MAHAGDGLVPFGACVRSLLVLAACKRSLVKVGCLRVLQECTRLDVLPVF